MNQRSLVSSVVSSAKATLHSLGYADKRTISVKIRVHKDLRETIDFVRTVQDAGVDFITIHGRTRRTRSSDPVDLDAIKLVAEHCSVPTISNGDIFSLSDAHSHASQTGVDGVMSARGLLQNPGLFAGKVYESCTWEVVERFTNEMVKAPIPFKLVVHHLSEMVGTDRSQAGGTLLSKEERMEMMACRNMLELVDFLDRVREVKRF